MIDWLGQSADDDQINGKGLSTHAPKPTHPPPPAHPLVTNTHVHTYLRPIRNLRAEGERHVWVQSPSQQGDVFFLQRDPACVDWVVWMVGWVRVGSGWKGSTFMGWRSNG